MKKLLIDEHPLIILPTLATTLGVNEAIFIQQLHYLLNRTDFTKDGKKWIYKTINDWEKEFPFFSTSTIKRTISSLKKNNILLVEKLSKDKRERVNYYSINYQKLNNIYQTDSSKSLKSSLKIVDIAPIKPIQESYLKQFRYSKTIFFSPSFNEEKTETSAFKNELLNPKTKISWDEIDANRKEEIFKELKTVEDIALPIEEFILRLEAGGYRYSNFVSAYRSWLLKEKTNYKEKHQKRVEEARRVEYLLSICNIPRRYKNAIFKPATKLQKKVAQYYIENFFKKPLEEATDMLLFGAIGTGKTYLSCAFALELIRKREIGVRYITEYELLNLYFQKEYIEFKSFKMSSVLIVDEIGKRELAEWQRVQLEELLSYRFNEMLPTIYITNLTEKRFKEFLGDRLADRLREANIARFAFVGESLRGKS